MKNILVYANGKDMKKFKALGSLKNLTYAPTLFYAALIPYDKLNRLIEWSNNLEDICQQTGTKIELRLYKGKTLHRVGDY